ncbi:hypothetical protein FACS189456_4000 [Bacteroidia bacterium]|nr:hypothetical protein FACS189456_4000 [Bacteroidia bacterium]
MAQFDGGAGTVSAPFKINTPQQLDEIRNHLTSGTHFRLTADIDLSSYNWTPIGNSTNKFTGHFHGAGHRITGLAVNTGTADYAGLFGYIYDGTIDSLGVILSSSGVTGRDYVGGLVGYMEGNNVKLSACYVVGTVKGTNSVGGLVGYYFDKHIASLTLCYAAGVVSGTSSVGGLIGTNDGFIEDCYATSQVSGNQNIGGLVGLNKYRIQTSYAIGRVLSSSANSGGLVGKDEPGSSYSNDFFDPETTKKNDDDGISSTDVHTLSVSNRHSQTTYNAWTFGANQWSINDGLSYPYFSYQSVPIAVNVIYCDSINLNIKKPADSIVVYKGAKLQPFCVLRNITAGTEKPFTTEIADKVISPLDDTLYFVTWESGKQPSYPVRAVVQKYPITIGTAYITGDTTIQYGESINPSRYKVVSGKLKFGHVLQGTMTLNVPSDSIESSTGYYKPGKYAFNFDSITIRDGSNTDVTDKYYEVTRKTDDSATIDKADISGNMLTFAPSHVLYNGAPHSVDVTWLGTLTGNGTKDSVYYNGSFTPPVEAREYAITVNITEGSNYKPATRLYIGNFTIRPTIFAKLEGDSMTYLGVQLQPTVKVYDTITVPQGWAHRRELKQDTNYTLSYGENIKVETGGTVIIKGIGTYEGNVDTLYFRIIPVKDDKTGVDSLVIKTITVSDTVFEALNKDNRSIKYQVPCYEKSITVAIGTENHNAIVKYNGKTQSTHSFTIPVEHYGTHENTFTVYSTDGTDSCTYTLELIKPIPFELVVITRWNAAMTVINNPLHNSDESNPDGFRFRSFKWYADGQLVSQSQSIPDAYSGYKLDPNATYRVELVTEDGLPMLSCAAKPALQGLMPVGATVTVKVYPNPVSNGELWVELSEEPSENGTDIEIYSIDGRLLWTQKTTSKQTCITLPFATGTYILRANQQAKVFVVK